MKESGAILTCLTNTSELCMWLESSNYLYGTTKNPYNL
jgi:fatty acid amide hydrolase 2